MSKNDMSAPAFRPTLKDLQLAFGLLTRLPLPYGRFDPDDPRPAAYASWAYPLVGLVVALLGALAGAVVLWLGLPAAVAALVIIAVGQLSTGAMHEDGLADCADGFWGGWTKERRLEIMKDSQIGTYGVLALIIVTGLRWLALTALITAGSFVLALVGAAVVSRAAMVGVMYLLPNARATGLSAATGRPPVAAVWGAAAMGLVACAALPAPFVSSVAVTLIVVISLCALARAKIGGQTGDVLGATQQCADCALILACLAALT